MNPEVIRVRDLERRALAVVERDIAPARLELS